MARRDTRKLILETSLALFNEHGEPNVSTNQIADEADISPGNLYYHFHNKQDIVLGLFKHFALQLNPILQVPPETTLEAEDLWFHLHLSFELKGRFRFLYRNLADLADRIPDLERAFRGLLRREQQAMTDIITSLEQNGALRISDSEKGLLLNNLMLALIYWVPYAELLDHYGPDHESGQIRSIAGVLQMITPYLKEPEHSEFVRLTASYLSHSG